MKDLNRFEFTGYVGAEPERKVTKEGSEYCVLRVGSLRSYPNENGEDETNWFFVTFWGDKASKYIIPYVHKGDKVFIATEINIEYFEVENGEKRRRYMFRGSDIATLVRGKNNNGESAEAEPNEQSKSQEKIEESQKDNLTPIDDDLPF